MDKLTYWFMAVILLCQFGWNTPTGNIYPEHRGMGDDAGKIVLFLIYIVISEYGKKLDRGYKCPVYCDVAHKHYYWENHENKESNIQTVDGLYITVRDTSQEQSASGI